MMNVHGWELRILLVTVALAAIARGWMLDFGLPWKPYPDEYAYVRKAFGMGANRDLNPHLFLSPPLWTYSLLPTFGTYYAVTRLTGAAESPRDFREKVHHDPTALYLVARAQTVVLSLLILWPVWRLARDLAGPVAAALAVVSLAIGPLAVREAHFAVNDTALTVVMALVLYATVRWYRELTRTRFVILGLLVGAAMAIKYNAVLIAPTAALAVWMSPRFTDGRQKVKGILALAALAALGFTLACPWWILDARTFFADALGQMKMGAEPWSEQPLVPTWRLVGQTVQKQIGIAGLLAAAGGGLLLLRRDRRAAAILLSFCAVYSLAMITSRLFYPRFVLPMVPALAVLLGIGAAGAIDVLGRRLPRPLVCGIVPLILFAGPLLGTLQSLSILATVDTRMEALRWVQTHVPPGRTLLDLGADLPLLSIMAEPKRLVHAGGLTVCRRNSLDCTAGDWSAIRDELDRADYVSISDNIWARHLGDGTVPPNTQAILAYLNRRGRLVAEFSPYTPAGSRYASGLCEPDIPFYEIERRCRIGNHVKIYRLTGDQTTN